MSATALAPGRARPPAALIPGLALAGAALAVLLLALMSGSYPLSPAEAWATLAGHAPSDTARTVVWELRLPRGLAGLLTGAFLALSGAILQHVTRNPLADPSLVGISQGAALAVVASAVLAPGLGTLGVGTLGVGTLGRPALALGGALAAAATVQALAGLRREGEALRFVLTGIGVAALAGAATQALLTYGDVREAMTALAWLAGSLHATGWTELAWLAGVAVAALPPLVLGARPLGALRFGEAVATGLGLPVRPARAALVALAVALAAAATAAVGPLAFVGLAAPHLARRLAPGLPGPGVGGHLVLTALTGALMTATADLAGRTLLAPVQIPAGLVTALIGGPAFVLLLLRTTSRAQP